MFRTISRKFWPWCVVFLLISQNIQGQATEPAAAYKYETTAYRLKNGLRVILSRDVNLPVVTVVVSYGAGPVRESEGQAGLAYFMQNLMFQGSENIGPLQHINYIQKIGGEVNAQITFDKVFFFQTVPSNQLALALWLESDRMKSLSITPAGVEKVRQDLQEELKRRDQSEVFYSGLVNFDRLLFPDILYGHPWLVEEAIAGLSLASIKSFYQTYYVPNNAVLCVVGNFQPARAKDIISRYFDTIPPGPDVPVPRLPVYNQEKEVSIKLVNSSASSSGFLLGYRLYPIQTGDLYTLKILEYVLLRGRTSRLFNRLIKRDMTAISLDGWVEIRHNTAALKIVVFSANEIMAGLSRKTILSEIEKLKVNPIPDQELTKAKRLFELDFQRKLSNHQERSFLLIDLMWQGKPVEDLSLEFNNYLRVAPVLLSSFINRTFVPKNRVVVELTGR